jgi:hypothetical protein
MLRFLVSLALALGSLAVLPLQDSLFSVPLIFVGTFMIYGAVRRRQQERGTLAGIARQKAMYEAWRAKDKDAFPPSAQSQIPDVR